MRTSLPLLPPLKPAPNQCMVWSWERKKTKKKTIAPAFRPPQEPCSCESIKSCLSQFIWAKNFWPTGNSNDTQVEPSITSSERLFQVKNILFFSFVRFFLATLQKCPCKTSTKSWIQEGFTAEPPRNDSGTNFQWSDSGFGPKVGVTGQKSELQTKSQSYSRADPQNPNRIVQKRPPNGA